MLGFRYMRRYRQIATTLMRHGFGWFIVKTGLSPVVPFYWGLLGHPRRRQRYAGPEHLRMAFEELGPTFCVDCAHLDRHLLATAAMEATFKEMFEHGFFSRRPASGQFFYPGRG